MEHVLVVGAGFMGAGIAQVRAASGRRVSLMDVSAEAVDRAGQAISSSLGKLAAKGKLSESPDEVAARVEMVQNLSPAATALWPGSLDGPGGGGLLEQPGEGRGGGCIFRQTQATLCSRRLGPDLVDAGRGVTTPPGQR